MIDPRTAIVLPQQISSLTLWKDTIGINFVDGKTNRIELRIPDMIALRDLLNQILPPTASESQT